MISEIARFNPQAISGSPGLFSQPGTSVWQLVQVLPCLKNFLFADQKTSHRLGEQALSARNESLHTTLERLFLRCLKRGKTAHVAIENLELADDSSLAVLLRCLQSGTEVQWHLGSRLGFRPQSAAHSAAHSSPTQGGQNFRADSLQQVLRQMQSTDQKRLRLSAVNSAHDNTDFNANSKSNKKSIHESNSAPKATLPVHLLLLQAWNSGHLRLLAALTSLPHSFTAHTLEFLVDNSTCLNAAPHSLNSPAETPVDSAEFANQVLARALREGILVEQRNCGSGCILAYSFADSRTHKFLALTLDEDLKGDVAMHAASRMTHAAADEQPFMTPLWLADCFLKANLQHCAHAAFACLTRDAETIPDASSSQTLAVMFALLEERLRASRSPDADSLVPRIREAMADLRKSMGQLQQASHYYGAVSWSTFDPKRRAILALKSFFPSELHSYSERREGYYRVIAQCESSGLFAKPERLHNDVDPNLQITHLLRKLQSLLRTETRFEGVHNVSPGIDALFSITLSNNESRAEKLPYAPRTRAIREITFCQFLRMNLGWIDGLDVYPQALRILQIGLAQEDGTVIVHALFTLLLALQRRLRTDVRIQLLDTIADVAARTNDETALAESILTKAFVSFFYDGNIAASHKHLELLLGSESELPLALRTCLRRLLVLCEFESEAVQDSEESLLPRENSSKSQNHEMHSRLARTLARHGMTRWEVAHATLGHSPSRIVLASTADEFLAAGVLLEQIDQILLYAAFSIDQADSFAASAVAKETKKTRCRRWFSDPQTQLAYLPESVARHFEGNASGNSRSADLPTNWSGDLSVEWNLKYDVATSPNPEVLTALAAASAHAGYFSLAHRLAHRAGGTLGRVPDELEQNGLARTRSAASDKASKGSNTAALINTLAKNNLPPSDAVSDVVLNYVLEFAHNLARAAEADKFSTAERKKLAHALLKSIPNCSDATETAIARALQVSVRKIAPQPSDPGREQAFLDERKTG